MKGDREDLAWEQTWEVLEEAREQVAQALWETGSRTLKFHNCSRLVGPTIGGAGSHLAQPSEWVGERQQSAAELGYTREETRAARAVLTTVRNCDI